MNRIGIADTFHLPSEFLLRCSLLAFSTAFSIDCTHGILYSLVYRFLYCLITALSNGFPTLLFLLLLHRVSILYLLRAI